MWLRHGSFQEIPGWNKGVSISNTANIIHFTIDHWEYGSDKNRQNIPAPLELAFQWDGGLGQRTTKDEMAFVSSVFFSNDRH